MTLNNLKLALQLNNAKINQEINLLIAYVNQFATNQKDLHYIIDNKLQSLDDDISQLNSDMTYQISSLDTKFTNQISTLSDDYSSHKNNTDIHITAEEREKWNNTTKYTDGTIKDHAENLTIHVTQADKDIWNATLGNAKAFAQELFNRLTSFEIIKCTQLPTEDIKTMTIYFLQIDPEQNDLYEEYMYIDGEWEKIGNTRIDLSDYVTKTMLQSEVDTLNTTITNKETVINQSIADLESKHDQDISDLTDTINNINSDVNDTIIEKVTEINTTITNKETEIKDLITDLETKHDNEIQSLTDSITQSVDDINQDITDLSNSLEHQVSTLEDKHSNELNDLEDKHDQDIQDIQDDLTNNYAPKLHEHDNKAVIDLITVDDNGNLLYNNKKIIQLDEDENGNFIIDPSILADYVKSSDLAAIATSGSYNDLVDTPVLHTHSNINVLNNLTQSVIDNSHNHENKSIIDKFSTNNNLLNYDGKIIATIVDNGDGTYSFLQPVLINGYVTNNSLSNILNDYAKTSDLHSHSNKSILDNLSSDTNNNLLYNNSLIGAVSQHIGNAIEKKSDGLFVQNYSNDIDTLKQQNRDLINQVSALNLQVQELLLKTNPETANARMMITEDNKIFTDADNILFVAKE